ncbi:DUF6879 family protein [Streptomyces sp. NBRC 110028]|uniref:DUF6879 family protein n=1 Tax=Streptomyces sp. NBRC 110028 TaxID=1621260 RepID=UPI0006E21850|nr:DUF6879 family protein [Streptomyces sp. NBRC 110028]
MPSPAPALDRALGSRLDLDAYHRDFAEVRARTLGQDSWKLERQQHFEEQNNPGRDALRRGDWDEVMRQFEKKRPRFLESVQKDRERGSAFHRVRVVEHPFTPYVRWELLSLRVQAECGKPIRVVRADHVREFEQRAILPEVVVLGARVLYEVVYTDEGVPDGAVRHSDPELVGPWGSFISDLYAGGEDVVAYVERHTDSFPPQALMRG